MGWKQSLALNNEMRMNEMKMRPLHLIMMMKTMYKYLQKKMMKTMYKYLQKKLLLSHPLLPLTSLFLCLSLK